MSETLEEQIQNMLAGMDEHNEPERATGRPETEDTEDIQEIYVLIVREHEEEEDQGQVVDSEPAQPQPSPHPFAYMTLGLVLICCLPMLASIVLQEYLLLNPPVATVTIIPQSQHVTMTGTLQLGRPLQPITVSQSQITATTGRGHQDARSATGTVTFYNGQFQNVTIAAGTMLTGASGRQIVTDQDAYVPPESQTIPPTLGHITVSAHALSPGAKGNIPTGDINQACCAPSILAQNTAPFHGGQDERDFSTVSQQDIHKLSTPLKTAVTQRMQGAFEGDLKPGEQLHLLPCRPTVTSDHQIGQEATQVKVTVAQTCSAVAYNSQEVAEQATVLLSTRAQQHLGTAYSLFGMAHISVQAATVTGSSSVLLSFSASGTWVYGLSLKTQEWITHLLAGKTTQAALQLLATLPGVEQATIRFTGFTDAIRLPKQSRLIHLVFVVM